ncbi:hypothetical protein HYT26_01420 [Candidatus Pacearchaeota archaeon]|nr:hypothetical protein [Candidatus Pacearchaeota archaeon]
MGTEKQRGISRELKKAFIGDAKKLNRFVSDIRKLISRTESLKRGYNKAAIKYFQGFIGSHMRFDRGIKDIKLVLESILKGKGTSNGL